MAREQTYGELIQLYQSGEIGWNEFVMASGDCEEYGEWLSSRGLEPSDDNARLFLKESDARMNGLEPV